MEKIEVLTARSRKAREALEAIPELLDQFRQSVLAAAFRGDLTADWREQNPDVEPAEALLERIRVERRQRWEEAVRDSGKDPARAKYKEPYYLDNLTLPDLPNSWAWGSLDQLLALLRNGIGRKPADEPPGIPILRISALRPMELNVEDFRYYRPNQNEKIDSYLLEQGDLLFTRYNGNKDFVGVCGRVGETPDKLLHPDKLIRGKVVSKDLLDSGFLEIVCNSGLSRKFIDSRVKTSAGQHGISGADLKMTPIPIPPISEQRVIVNRVEQQFRVIESLAELTESKLEDFEQLDQSILAKAFRGELVPQDPNDEPAAVLLERIRAERSNSKGKIQKAKRKKGSKGVGGVGEVGGSV